MTDKCFMLDFGLVKNIFLSRLQFGFSLFTEIVISTESMTKPRFFFELFLRLIYQSVL